MRLTAVLLCGLLAASCTPAPSPAPDTAAGFGYGVPGALERARIKTAIVEEKIRTALLPAMRTHGIDMWIVLDRENHPDPLHEEIGGGFAGVRSAYIFFDSGGTEPEKIYLGSHVQPGDSVIEQVYDEKVYYGYSGEGITPHLREAVHSRDPQRIGINTSRTLPEADGLTVAFRDVLVEAIGSPYSDRLVSAELLIRDFRNLRTPLERDLYRQLTEWTARWETEGLTGPHVVPGETTALEMAGWFEDKALELGMGSFQTVRVVREGDLLPRHAADIPIQPGDIVAVDAGLFYLQFESDMKRTAYVLGPGETEPPESIRSAWAEVIQTSRLYASKMVPAPSGTRSTSRSSRRRSATGTSGTPEPTRASGTSGPNTRSRSTDTRWATTCTTSAPGWPPTCRSLTGTGCASRWWRASSSPWSSTSGCPSPSGTGRSGRPATRRSRRWDPKDSKS